MTPNPIPSRGPSHAAAAHEITRQAHGKEATGDGHADFQAALQQKLDAQESDGTEAAERPADNAAADASSSASSSPKELWAMVAEFFSNPSAAGAGQQDQSVLEAGANPEPEAGQAVAANSATTKQPQGPAQPDPSLTQSTAATTDAAAFSALLGGKEAEAQPGAEAAPLEAANPNIGPDLATPTSLSDSSTSTLARDTAATNKASAASQGIQTPVGQNGWREALGDRILWLANRDISAAQLRLNPEHLGPVDVNIKLDGEGASIQFTAQNAGTREALEAAVPRLREMFGSQHLSLNEVTVAAPPQSAAQADSRNQSFDFQRQPGGNPQDLNGQPSGSGGPHGDIAGEEPLVEPGKVPMGAGLVNFFA